MGKCLTGVMSWISRLLLHWFCRRLPQVSFRLTLWDGRSTVYGKEPAFHITVRTWRAVWRILRAPDPAFGDAYVHGDIEIDGLEKFLDAYTAAPPQRFLDWPTFRHIRRKAPLSEQYKEVQSHYDRGDAFFSLWLDSTRSYSCAYFRHRGDTLELAQAAKIDHVLNKAQLRPGQRLLDIGSGWGALILRAARRYGVRAHGITLSRQQYEFTRQAIRNQGLQDRVSVQLMDFRELALKDGGYDRIVSVGMVEHVGEKDLGNFLQAIARLLVPGGAGVLHHMTRIREAPVSPWIQKHVFPGSYVPSWREMIHLYPEFNFHLIDVESLRRHYALTLTHWADRFEERLDEVVRMGYDPSFIRMWRLYLRSCAAAFQSGRLDLHQFVFTRGVNNHLAMTREPLYSPEYEPSAAVPSLAAY